MNILALDSALNKSYFGFLYEGEKIYKTLKSDENNYHSLYLISEIKKCAEIHNIDFKKLEAIAVNTGTGSFTGIRVAMSIAKVLACELNLPLIPLVTNEILLRAFQADLLITDARRDMFFVSTKEETKLIYKDKITDLDTKDKKILVDKRCIELFPSAICYEDKETNLAETMIDLALEKFSKGNDFNYLKAEANYIQTPPIF